MSKPEQDGRFEQALSASNYLQQLRQQYPELPQPVAGEEQQRLQQLTRHLTDLAPDQLSDAGKLRQQMLKIKAEFVLHWCHADLMESLPQQELGRLQSRFADACLEAALRAACLQEANSKLLPELEPGSAPAGLFILGLGKLGGEDLNFSSDIDLVAFFDRDAFKVGPMQGAGDVAARLLRWLTRFLEGDQGQPFLWRVDWRLRPEASATQLVMSVNAALDYYYFRAVPWHRLAMMKARPVAGDLSAAASFLADMERFIWRQNLDFRAIDELAQLKDRIDLEHPGLKRQRTGPQPITEQAEGVNLKLGSGGIREIEFLVNALQLIWGGKKTRLRVTHTLTALQRLAEEGLAQPELVEQFTRHYCWLRRCENHLQMLGNQQTHRIPEDQLTRDRFARLAGVADWEDFSRQLYQVRQQVHREFAALFRAERSADEREESDPEWPALSAAAQEIVDIWEEGFQAYGVSASQASGMSPLYRYLGHALLESGLQLEQAIQRLHAYFRRLPPGGQYFRLLQRSPDLIDGLVTPLLYSPPMQTLLEQTPHIIDVLLEQSQPAQLSDDFVFHSGDYEVRLERMRRLVNEQLYLRYLRFLRGELTPLQLQDSLTGLAEFALRMALKVVCHQLKVAEPPVAIMGLGKLGMAKMAPLSDLDILYVSAEGVELDQVNRFVHRLQTALATPMKEGVVYEMDTRLRPSGQSGPPTVSLAGFEQYQRERAKTWEHQALITARYVAGHQSTGQEVMAVRRRVLSRRRAIDQLVMDAAKMRERIHNERIARIADDVINTKLRPGGLMEAEYLVSLTLLKHAADAPELLDCNYDEAVKIAAGLLDFPELADALEFWRVLQLWERLLGLTGQQTADIPHLFSERLCRHLGVASPDELVARSRQFAVGVEEALEQQLKLSNDQQKLLADWMEQPIEWHQS